VIKPAAKIEQTKRYTLTNVRIIKVIEKPAKAGPITLNLPNGTTQVAALGYFF
jgi:hypothetical protein